jgi:hypothetical protein
MSDTIAKLELGIRVRLTREEMVRAADEGVRRRIDGIVKGRPGFYGFTGIGFNEDIIGCLGEMAACKVFGTYWAGNETRTRGIDGTHFEVRSTARSHPKLIIHDRDHDHLPYILAHIELPVVTLVGFISGKRAKEFPVVEPQPGRPCRWIDPEHLDQDWTKLREFIAKRFERMTT